jgi:hypothetical protein
VMMAIARGQAVLPGLGHWYQQPAPRRARHRVQRPRVTRRVRARAMRQRKAVK